jgi:hypothetical protein
VKGRLSVERKVDEGGTGTGNVRKKEIRREGGKDLGRKRNWRETGRGKEGTGIRMRKGFGKRMK